MASFSLPRHKEVHGSNITAIDYKDIELHESLGHGAGGQVNRATFKKSLKGRKEGAAKTVLTDKLRKEEIEILAGIDHPNIVQLLGTCKLGHVDIILLEYTCHGSLHDYLSDRKRRLKPELKRKWIKEAVLAVEYLHARNYLHRDLKASNCLLFETDILKLADFGLAREINHTETTSTQKGTPRYMAPELHVGNYAGRAIFSKPADIYALGMLILEICTRKLPFSKIQVGETVIFKVGHGEQPEIPEDCPKEFADLMRRCWSYNPRERPAIDSIKRDLFRWTLERSTNPYQKISRLFHRIEALKAYRVACCSNGDMAVTDTLYLLDPEGKFKKRLSMASKDQSTEWIQNLTCSDGNILTVYGTNEVKVFDEDLRQTESFSTLPAAETSTAQLVCIATDGKGSVFVYDRKKRIITVHKWNQENLVYLQKNVFKIEYDIDSLEESMVVNSKNQILLHFLPREAKYSKVLALDTSGKEVFSFIPKIDEVLDDDTVSPCGIGCDVYDVIYIALRVSNKNFTGRVYRYSPRGELMDCIAEGLYRPSDLSLTMDRSDQSLVVANWQSLLVYSLK